MYTTIKKKIVTSLCLLAISTSFMLGETRTHVVQKGETLYRISNLYGVTIEAIQAANQGIILGNNVPSGATIVIPEVQKGQAAEKVTEVTNSTSVTPVTEAVPAVASVQEPVADGSHSNSVKTIAEKVSQWFGSLSRTSEKEYTLAVILPFNLASKSTAEDKLQMRSVEFYQGVLLAVNRAQLGGMHIRVLTYDLGTESIAAILAHPEMLEADVILSPMEVNDIREVALFGESHGINVINPFKLVPDLTPVCKHLFQLNTYISSLYPELSAELKDRFDDYAYVFVTDSMFTEKTDPYAASFKDDLKKSGISYYEYMYGSPESVLAMDTVLNLLQSNILLIPESSQRDALRRFFPSLKNKLFLEAHPEVALAALATEDPERYEKEMEELQKRRKELAALPDSLKPAPRQIAILGYPEWQLYTQDFMDHFYDMNVWMFCKFYVDPFDFEVADTYAKFRYWYAREMLDLYPKYGMLGYDVAAYALQMMGTYGKDFDKEAEGKYFKTLQNAMLFRRVGDGGFVNKGMYLVHFTPESTIEKFEIK